MPHKTSLIAQTRDVLERGIESGRWRFVLPGERKLVSELGVSRGTLRMALAALARQGLLRVRQGQPSEILKRSRARRRKEEWRVGCVLPEPLWKLRPFLSLMIDALRVRVQELGGQLTVHHGARYFGASCARELAELTRQSPHDCWVLVLSTHAMQAWFHAKQLPVVVAGSSYEEVKLPSVDFDLMAAGRHAAGLFLARGHRRIFMLSSHKGHAGILDTERGLREGLEKSPGGGELLTEFHKGAPADVCRRLDRLWARPNPPEALFILQSNTWLAASGHLARRGVHAPRDVAMLLGQDEPHISHLVPEPARYAMAPDAVARQIASLAQRARDRILPPGTTVRLVPKFIAGQTLGPPCA